MKGLKEMVRAAQAKARAPRSPMGEQSAETVAAASGPYEGADKEKMEEQGYGQGWMKGEKQRPHKPHVCRNCVPVRDWSNP